MKVIFCPGHTLGCACFLDSRTKILFSGDAVLKRVGISGTNGPLYKKSLQHLLEEDFTEILGAHWLMPMDREQCSRFISLIDDFDPVGISFVSPNLTEAQLNAKAYENPDRHQGVRHPRSVIAKTENNHVLFIVIDGRRTNLSEGMTANEVTRFLVKNFNPQYALNLDGGGSSALCVKGQGDSSTNVVNYPSDDSNNTSHSGERAVNTHFYVIERNN